MKNKIYIAIICAFSIVFAVSSGFLIKHYYDSAKQAEMYDNLIEVVETEPEETKEPMNYSEEKTFIPEYQELYLQNKSVIYSTSTSSPMLLTAAFACSYCSWQEAQPTPRTLTLIAPSSIFTLFASSSVASKVAQSL